MKHLIDPNGKTNHASEMKKLTKVISSGHQLLYCQPTVTLNVISCICHRVEDLESKIKSTMINSVNSKNGS